MSAEFAQRDKLIQDIHLETALTRNLTGIAVLAAPILKVLRETPREVFVANGQQHLAYANQALPVGFGQTISQPFIVALMTHLLAPTKHSTILEIGTGSGYQAAVLSALVKQVVSVEIIPALAAAAESRLRALQLENVDVHCADGYHGWSENSPYDGIIITACAPVVPPELIKQLAAGGRMVLPIGESYGHQELRLIQKAEDGSLSSRAILPVAFVPFTRAALSP